MLIAFILYEVFSLLFAHYLIKASKGEYPLSVYIITGHLWPYVVISSIFMGKGGDK
jgi:hypothetical protein